VAIFVPLGAILLQVLLPRLLPALAILDLPLVVTLFFAVSRRSPIAGTVTGATIGLLQDVLTSQPIGVNGMAKSVIGYAAASLGSRIDVENTATRALLTFGFSLLQSALLYLIERRLLGIRGFQVLWLHELIGAAANTVVAVPIFTLLDRAKHRE
jgi:rod shape-determining protein MreD